MTLLCWTQRADNYFVPLTLNLYTYAYLSYRNIRDDIEQEDVEEAFYRYMEENPLAGVYMEDDEIVEYDEVFYLYLILLP